MRVYVNTHSILEHYQGILALAYTCAHYYDILALQPPDYSSKYTEADMQEDKEHFMM